MKKTLPLLPLLLLAWPARAGELDHWLAWEMNRADPKAFIPAFVYMADQVDLPGLEAWLDHQKATRRHRHEVVVRSLQEKAEASLAALQPTLDRMIREQTVRGIVPFWIFNGVFLEGTPWALAELARRADVGKLYFGGGDNSTKDLIEPIPGPIEPPGAPPVAAVIESGIIECKADLVWAAGYTGVGRIVANIDSGVDGNHNALRARWRGLVPGVPSTAAWHDSAYTPPSTFPRVRSSSHGTHTMGTICGDDLMGNQIGVAPGALWIASSPIDAPGTRAQKNVWYNQGIQWCADPDGNPATITDVPDTCGNSWGVRDAANGVPPCSPVFNASLDAAEASTCAFVWAAGNEGITGPRVPADRIASTTNSFSVGALDVGSMAIASFSSRGPSPCDTITIKPEVSARGVNVRSSLPTNTYGNNSGTSMACPHVTGGVALLRQVWPDITVVRVKEILMQTADDLGTAGEDNTFGWGRINLQRAYQQVLAERPRVALNAMGVRQTWRDGQVFYAHLAVTNYTNVDQTVNLSASFYFDNAPTNLVIIPPVNVTIPAGFTTDPGPFVIALPLPLGLPSTIQAPHTWSFRAFVREPNFGPIIHQSQYNYQLIP
jgi:subtilisin family serine protease